MELQVYFVIAIVFLASFLTLLFISKLPRGKTFDEVLAEKRQMAEKLYGQNYTQKRGGGGKKNQKQQNNKKTNKAKTVKLNKEIEAVSEENESDEHSDENQSDGSSSQASTTPKSHVEFVNVEIIPPEPVVPLKKTVSPSNVKPPKKKNSKSPGVGILVNKAEPVAVKNVVVVEQLNNFEEMVPKDVVELKRDQKEAVDTKPNKSKDQKKGKNKREVVEVKEEVAMVNGFVSKAEKIAQDKPQNLPSSPVKKESVTLNQNHPKERKSNESGGKDKSKKKKTEVDLVQSLLDERDGLSVDFLVPLLSQAELTRNEIQLLIDFLLNKQQDTTVDHLEWSEGRGDVLIKLKKQLNEKDKALQQEVENSAAIQKKVNDLRNDITAQRLQFNVTIKSQAEDINAKKQEIQTLTAEIQYLKEKYLNEKQTMTVQLQQMQKQLIQEKKTNNPDLLTQLQQLTETNTNLNSDLVGQNVIISELKEKFQQHQFQVNEEAMKKISEFEQKCAEYECVFRGKEADLLKFHQDMSTKHIQELSKRDEETHRLMKENDKLEGLIKMKNYEIEQIKQQLDQQAKAAHHEDANKVEMRNLQNALDSSMKESKEYKKINGDLTAQIRELNGSVAGFSAKNVEQSKQVTELNNILAEYKSTIADKESSLSKYEEQMRSVTDKENELFKQIQEVKDKNNSQIDIKKVLLDEQHRIRNEIEHALPEFSASKTIEFSSWIETLGQYINNLSNTAAVAATNQHNTSSSSQPSAVNNVEHNSKEINSISNNTNNSDDAVDPAHYNSVLEQNKNLQERLDSFRKVLTETEGVLNNLEKQSIEKEVLWQGIVETKNAEIEDLQKLVDHTT